MIEYVSKIYRVKLIHHLIYLLYFFVFYIFQLVDKLNTDESVGDIQMEMEEVCWGSLYI